MTQPLLTPEQNDLVEQLYRRGAQDVRFETVDPDDFIVRLTFDWAGNELVWLIGEDATVYWKLGVVGRAANGIDPLMERVVLDKHLGDLLAAATMALRAAEEARQTAQGVVAAVRTITHPDQEV